MAGLQVPVRGWKCQPDGGDQLRELWDRAVWTRSELRVGPVTGSHLSATLLVLGVSDGFGQYLRCLREGTGGAVGTSGGA